MLISEYEHQHSNLIKFDQEKYFFNLKKFKNEFKKFNINLSFFLFKKALIFKLPTNFI